MTTTTHNRILRILGEYVIAIFLCLLILTWALQLFRTSLRVPLEWGGDALYYGMVTKGIIDHGWFLHNDSIGAPLGTDLHEFPMPDAVNFALMKLLSLFSSDHAIVLNLVFILSFPLVAVSALFVQRHFGLAYLPSLLASLLYTFAPYHFLRHVHHLFLSTYYMVPLVIMVALWILSGTLLKKSEQGLPALRGKRFIAAIVICVIASSVGWGYYAFFSCFFLLVAGILRFIHSRSGRELVAALILIAVVTLGLFLNLIPNANYVRQHGQTAMARRDPVEAETYGLKIVQLILPIENHRISALAALKDRYNKAPLTNDNRAASLGLFATLGFLFLIIRLLVRPGGSKSPPESAHGELLNHLSTLNILGVLLATIGGFGSLVALLAFPQIRSYNRISIFLAFFSIVAIAVLLDRAYQSPLSSRFNPGMGIAGFAILLALGVLDQTNSRFIHLYQRGEVDFQTNREFVHQLEQRLPQGSMVFQLPYIPFPEAGETVGMGDYEHFKAYLNSKHLRWSYGATRGRRGDLWQQSVAALGTAEFVESLSLAGFSGIYVDRKGYDDKGKKIETELATIVTTPPLASSDGQWVFFDLTDFNQIFRQKFTSDEWETRRRLMLDPLIVRWESGCYGLEKSEQMSWRWCQKQGELRIVNNSSSTRNLQLSMSLTAAQTEPAALSIRGPLIATDLNVGSTPTEFSPTLTVPPGGYTIRFVCDGRPADAPTDPRTMVLRVMNFSYREK